MQFNKEKNLNTSIRSVENNRILIGENYINYPCILNSKEVIGRWEGKNVDKITIKEIEYILKKEPDVLIFGTGKEPVTPERNLIFNLAKKGIGLEVMTTPAACRTFNILISEGRDPIAILIL
jgi:uncharacterized protein